MEVTDKRGWHCSQRNNRDRGNSLDALSILDLVFSPMTDEHRLATPFDDDVLALRDGRQIDLDFGLGQHVGGGRHVD